MNKIIVDTREFNLNLDEYLFLDIKRDSIINIKINNDKLNKLLIFTKNNKVIINIKINDNGNLEINNLGINSCIDYNINIMNNSNLVIVDSILSELDSINNINIKNIGNNNNSLIYTNGINLSNNKLYFNLNGNVIKDSINSVITENSKIINIQDGDSKIVPNLIIDTKEVIANHSAFIGTFNIEELCYLMSRGISKENAKDLLLKSIILNGMKLNIEDFVDEINEFLKIRR